MVMIETHTWADLVNLISSRRRHTIWTGDWSSDVCSSDLTMRLGVGAALEPEARRFVQLHRKVVAREAGEAVGKTVDRSEERRVGKECRCRTSADLVNAIADH